MFDNIGGKIKALAQGICWIGIVLSVIAGLVVMFITDGDAILAGLLIMLFGILASWLGSFISFGFGQLIENSDKLVALQTAGKASRSAAEKLNLLNKWKAEGLITEEEYTQKAEALQCQQSM